LNGAGTKYISLEDVFRVFSITVPQAP